MSPEELRACRERAEAATPGPLLAEPDGDGGYGTFTPHGLRQSAEAHTAFIAHARTDVPRLLATIDAAQRETASHRRAALLAAGIHGGPGAWRWRSDPQGTILDDTEAWERLLGEMRERTGRRAPVQGTPKKRGPGTIAWDEHVLAWSGYSAICGTSQGPTRIAERGGFGYDELTRFLGHEPKTWAPVDE